MEQLYQGQAEESTILVFYHKEDSALWDNLQPHLDVLAHRLPATRWCFYMVPFGFENSWQKARFEENVTRSICSVFCTSAALISGLLAACTEMPSFHMVLQQTTLLPLPLRAMAHMDFPNPPLAASASGHERDLACTQMILGLEEMIEEKLMQQSTLSWNPWLEEILTGIGKSSLG